MGEENEESDKELRQKYHDNAYANLLKCQLSNNENADRAVLNVSTAALGFSLVFIKDIVPLSVALFTPLLYLSWGLFISAIVIVLVSFFVSQKAIHAQFKVIDRYYLEGDRSAESTKTKLAMVTDVLNVFGAISLVIGIIVTCLFVGINIYEGRSMGKSQFVNDGASVPAMQRIPEQSQNGVALSPQAPLPNPQGGMASQMPVTPASTEGGKGK